jgi:2-oxo-3-hexenedioate decarboxylase
MIDIADTATLLDQAAVTRTPVRQFDPGGTMPLATAYAIQAASIARRAARGDDAIGVKMGLTSRAKMVQMGLSDVIWGRLTRTMLVEEGGNAPASRFIRPRVEPEIAFLLKRDLPGRATAAESLAAVEAIAPAIEIIDSRYMDFKFSLPEVIADNASASGFVVGQWSDPTRDMSNLGVVLSVDGAIVQTGSSAALLGHPVRSLVAAARLGAEGGAPLRVGSIVLAGGITPAEWVLQGQYVKVEVEGLGAAGFGIA